MKLKSINRALAVLLLPILLVSLFAGCSEEKESTAQAESGSAKLWYAYNTENLMQDLEYPEKMEARDSTLRMYGVRNDVESVQLMITPEINIVSYDMQMADLKNENGDVFAAENFELFAQWYTEVTESYNNEVYYGYYPDALVPLKNFSEFGYNFISAKQNQGIWVQANIPMEQAPGHYTGTAKLMLDETEYSIPVELTVFESQIPVENHLPSGYGVWFEQIAYGEGFSSDELAEAYTDFLIERRIMPIYVLPHKAVNYETYIDWLVEENAENPAISSYRLLHEVTDYELGRIVDRDSIITLLTMMAEKNIELREAGNETIDLFKKAYYYLGNVVDEPTGTSLQRVRDCDLIITECKFEVANKYFKDKYPDLYESCLAVGHLVTASYNPELVGSDTVGGVQTWCPQYQHWHTEAQRQEYYNRRDTEDRVSGEGIWWYGCNNPKAPYPTYHLDDDLIGTRVLSWMQFEYDVEGDLYYAVNIVNHSDNAYPWTKTYYDDAANDGRLVYPGSKFGIFGPVSTLRLESIAQGKEDYECLLMIENAILAYNEANGTDHDPKELMSWLYDGLYEGVIPERDNAEGFAEARLEMLRILELIQKDPQAGIEALQ